MAKSVGVALYLEFRREENTQQFLFTPEVVSPESGKVVNMYFISRQVSAANPRRSWRFRECPTVSKGDAYGNIAPISDPQAALAVAAERVEFVQSYLSSMESGGWTLYKMPLAIEMTGEDALKIEKRESPAALVRRLVNARAAADFDESFWKVA